ncbi:NAD-dependent epimerase/dehydratase family protein [Sphingobacterium sp. NPDC055346]
MEIIITGKSGFVSKYFQANLDRSLGNIISISVRNEGWKSTIPSSANVLIHLAGKAHDTLNTSSAQEYFKINRDLSIELFDYFLLSEIKDFFYFSSVKAAADSVKGELTEKDTPNPETPYGKSKLEAEEYMLTKHLPPNKRLFIVRPCMIHGPGNKGNLNYLYHLVKKGIPWPLGQFDNKRSFLNIGNLCFVIENMIRNKNLNSGVYNVADDDAISTNDLIRIISKNLGKKTVIWNLNRSLVEKIAKVGDMVSLPLNSERLKKLTESYVVSNEKLKAGLKIKNLPISVEEGLDTTIKSFNS